MPYIQELRSLVGHRPLILVGTMVMIFDEQQRVLLQHRTDDFGSGGSTTWDFPGGFMEPGESTEETARREVLEETGLEIGQMTLFQVLSGEAFFYTCPNGDQVFSVSTVYVTDDVRGEARADGVEGSEVRFFPLDDLPSDLIPNDRMVIETFLAASGFERFLLAERNKRIVRRYYEDARYHPDVCDAIFAPVFRFHTLQHASFTEQVIESTPQNEKASYAWLDTVWGDWQMTIDEMLAEGERVMVRWTFHGLQQGEYLGLPPTHQQVTYSGINIFRIANGRIAEIWDLYDRLWLWQQLGVLPDVKDAVAKAQP